LARNPFGKPYIQDAPRSLGFNVSHSQGLAAIAVSEVSDIGVDVEQLRPMEHIPQMVGHFFSTEEQARFAQGSDSDLALLFFQHWTGKEAYIKALGEGLSHPLDRFSVEVGGRERKYPIRRMQGSDSRAWFGLAPEAPLGYVAALVAPGEHWTVKACGFV
jgi:4'-phosphopantetheinyl transferase